MSSLVTLPKAPSAPSTSTFERVAQAAGKQDIDALCAARDELGFTALNGKARLYCIKALRQTIAQRTLCSHGVRDFVYA